MLNNICLYKLCIKSYSYSKAWECFLKILDLLQRVDQKLLDFILFIDENREYKENLRADNITNIANLNILNGRKSSGPDFNELGILRRSHKKESNKIKGVEIKERIILLECKFYIKVAVCKENSSNEKELIFPQINNENNEDTRMSFQSQSSSTQANIVNYFVNANNVNINSNTPTTEATNDTNDNIGLKTLGRKFSKSTSNLQIDNKMSFEEDNLKKLNSNLMGSPIPEETFLIKEFRKNEERRERINSEEIINLLEMSIENTKDWESLFTFQKIFLLCPLQRYKIMINIKKEIDKIINSSRSSSGDSNKSPQKIDIITNLIKNNSYSSVSSLLGQKHNNKFLEVLRLDLFNEVFENIFKCINKFYFKKMLDNDTFKDRLENLLVNYWKLKSNFEGENMLKIDFTTCRVETQGSLTNDFSRKESVMSTASQEENLLKRFRQDS